MTRLRMIAVAVLIGAATLRAEAALIEVIRGGHDPIRTVELIAQGADVNAAEPDGTTALIWAAHYGDVSAVEHLIEAGADVARQNIFGATAMSEAAIIGSKPILRLLLEAGADPNAGNPEGETALMLTARTGNVEAAQLLLSKGANVNAREEWGGQSALMWASAQLQPEMVALLLANGADANARGAVRNWGRKITAEPRPKDMHRGGFTPLLYAVRGGCMECARHLIAAGADLDLADPDGITPIQLALMNYQYDVAAFLIEAGADVNLWDLYGRTPLYVAIDMNTVRLPRHRELAPGVSSLEVARLLLQAGANPNTQLKQWRPPFRNAIGERGTDNTLTTGATPLLRAAHASDVEAIRLLLAYPVHVNLPNASGVTPLLAAAGVAVSQRSSRAARKSEADSIEAVELLLGAGADIHAATVDRRRVHRDPQAQAVIGRLVYRFADIPPDGMVAAHGAATFGWSALLETLVQHGARLDVSDTSGRTPLDLAMGRYEPAPTVPPPDPHHETAEVLRDLCRRSSDCDLLKLGDAEEVAMQER